MTYSEAPGSDAWNPSRTPPTVASSLRHGMITAIRRFSARSIRQQIYHSYRMNPRAGRLAAYLCAAGFLYASFLVGTAWSDAYVSQYGNFLLSRGELAFKLNLLLFILPAILFLSAAIAETRTDRLAATFDALDGRRLGRLQAVALALAVLCLAMLVRIYVLRESVVTDDENVYHFQARLLESGLSTPPPRPSRSAASSTTSSSSTTGAGSGCISSATPRCSPP